MCKPNTWTLYGTVHCSPYLRSNDNSIIRAWTGRCLKMTSSIGADISMYWNKRYSSGGPLFQAEQNEDEDFLVWEAFLPLCSMIESKEGSLYTSCREVSMSFISSCVTTILWIELKDSPSKTFPKTCFSTANSSKQLLDQFRITGNQVINTRNKIQRMSSFKTSAIRLSQVDVERMDQLISKEDKFRKWNNHI